MNIYLELFIIGLAATINLPPVVVLLTFFANKTKMPAIIAYFVGYTATIFLLSLPMMWLLSKGFSPGTGSGGGSLAQTMRLLLGLFFLGGAIYYYFNPPKTDATSKFLEKLTKDAATAEIKQGLIIGCLVRLLNPFGIVIYAYGLQQLSAVNLAITGAVIGWALLTIGLEATMLIPFGFYLAKPKKTASWLGKLQDYTIANSGVLPMIGLLSMSLYFFIIYFSG